MLKHLNLEMIAAATAMLVSVAALFVAWDQSVVMRAQQHASVWPVLEGDITIDVDQDGYFISFDIQNLGVGPAMIKSAQLRVNGTEVTDFEEFDRLVLVEGLATNRTIRSSTLSGIVGANQSKTALKIIWESNEQNGQAFRELATKYSGEAAPDIDLVMCYCSVFDKCWIANDTNESIPRQVESCPISDYDPIRRLMNSI